MDVTSRTNNCSTKERVSPTATTEFPSTPTAVHGNNHTNENQQDLTKAATNNIHNDNNGPAFVTPSPTRPPSTRTSTHDYFRHNDDDIQDTKLRHIIPMDDLSFSDSGSSEDENSKHKNKDSGSVGSNEDSKPSSNKNSIAKVQGGYTATASVAVAAASRATANKSTPSPDDEKTRARQARLEALALQQQKQPQAMHRRPRTPDLSNSLHASLTPPPRPSRSFDSKSDLSAKRRGRASSFAATLATENNIVRKLPPPPPPVTTALTRRSTTTSSVDTSSTGSTTVTQNTRSSIAMAASAAQIQAVSLVLEDDDDDDNSGIHIAGDPMMAEKDQEAKRRARASATGGQKLTPARRHTATADAAVKRNASMTARELAQRGRRRRTTTQGLTTGSTGSSGASIISDTEDSQHSTASSTISVGAHSVTGGRRMSKKSPSTEDGEEEKEEDAVQEYLTSLATSQAAAAAASVATNNQLGRSSSHDSTDEMTKEKVKSSYHPNSIHTSTRTQVDMILEEGDEDLEDDEGEFANAGDDEEVEAQAGVPVIQPGAFAIEGVDGAGRNDDWNNEPFDSDLPNGSSHHSMVEPQVSGAFSQNDPTLTDPNSALFFDEELALEAELYDANRPQFLQAELHQEAVLVDAQVLTEDPEGLSAKALRRLRMMQCTVFCLALGAIAAVVGVAVTRPDSSAVQQWQNVIPTIQGWKQVGNNLTGPTDDDKSLYGYSIALAGHAERIAIGLPGRDQGATKLRVGEVHIMDWNGTQWLPNSNPLLGPGPDAQAGSAVAISKNGKRVAIGSPFFAQGGHVSVFEEIAPQEWLVIGQVLVGNSSKDGDERFGSTLSLSEDGNTLAVGAPMGEGTNETDSGYVKVFQMKRLDQSLNKQALETNTSATTAASFQWVQIGNTIFGENGGDFFGWSLAISASGTRIVAGSAGSTGNGVGEFSGQARVFDFDEDTDTWVQSGPSIAGNAAFDSFGSSVAMSGKGDIVAVGAIGHSNSQVGVDIGHVRVFQQAGSEADWQPLGQSLVGQDAFDSFGYSVSLSEDGRVLAAGGPRNDEFSESSGHIQVFELDEVSSSWVRRGGNIGGSYAGRDLFGWSLALSSDGTRVAGGAPFSTFDGRLNDVGTVRIYDVARNATE